MEKSVRGKIVNLNEFYELTGIAPSTVRNKYVGEGMPGVEPGSGRGDGWKINTRLAIDWLIEKKAKELSGAEENDEGEVIFDEDRRLKKLRGDKIELDLAREKGELIPTAFASSVVRDVASFLGKSIDGIPASMADELSGMSNPAEIKELLTDHVRKLRAQTVERAKEQLSSFYKKIY